MSDIYSENILDHYKNPRNFGKIENHTHQAHGDNPMCGDEIDMQILVGRDGKIDDIKFSGTGCAISMASASMLTEEVMGKNIAFVKNLDRKKLLSLLGIELSPVRLKCALLPLYVLKLCAGERMEI